MARFCLVFFCFLFIAERGNSQSLSTIWQQAEEKAKTREWEDVRTLIQPHLFPLTSDSLAPWLLQLYAIACEKTGDRVSSLISAEKIITEFPTWAHANEALFQAGKMKYKMRRFSDAWAYFEKLPSSYSGPLEIFLSKETDLPSEAVTNLQSAPEFKESDISRAFFKQKKDTTVKIQGHFPVPKIGIVLPFQLKNIKKTKADGPVFDFYRGLLLGAEVLAAQDSAVDIRSFDSQNKDEFFNKLISDRAFDGLQVVIGPLKTSHLDLWAKSSKTQNIPLINPLSNYSPNGKSPVLFTQQASYATMARESFLFISRLSKGRKVGIVFGPERNDSLAAIAYSDYAEKMGRDVVLFKKVGKNSAANLTKFLLESGLDSTDHLFVPNNEPLVRVQLLSAYSWIKGKFPILVLGKWLEAGNADFQEMARHPVYFMNPDLPDRQVENWKAWESSYLAKWGRPPSWVAWKGFDLILSFARSWYSYGPNWKKEWKSGDIIYSPLFGGYRFTETQSDNQYLPIYSVTPDEIKKVWPE